MMLYPEQQLITAVRHACAVWADTQERDIDVGTDADVNGFVGIVCDVLRLNYGTANGEGQHGRTE